MLFLEIKDWKLATIKDINHDRVVLNTDRGDVTTANPLEQAGLEGGLDHRYFNNSYQKKRYNQSEDKVTVLVNKSIRQSSKGLEFKTVILAGLGTLKG